MRELRIGDKVRRRPPYEKTTGYVYHIYSDGRVEVHHGSIFTRGPAVLMNQDWELIPEKKKLFRRKK